MGFVSSLLGGVTSLVGGVMKNKAADKAADKANAATLDMQREAQTFNAGQSEIQRNWERDQASSAMAFESAQAERQMDFQNASNAKAMGFSERMSSSAHQREVQDLRAAGLNPILSGTGGMGSSTPVGVSSGGSMARGQKGSGSAAHGTAGAAVAASVVDALTPAIASAVSVGQVVSNITKQTAETSKVEAETATEGQRLNMVKAQVADYTESAMLKEFQRRELGPGQKDKINSEIAELESRLYLQAKQAVLAQAQTSQSHAQAGKTTEETKALEIDRFLRKQVMELDERDVPQALKDFNMPVDFIKGALLYILKSRGRD